MRIKDDEFPTFAEFAERLELRELERLARTMMALSPACVSHHRDDDYPIRAWRRDRSGRAWTNSGRSYSIVGSTDLGPTGTSV